MSMNITENQYVKLEREVCSLLKALKREIGDDYRASDDPEDNMPGMQVTIGATPKEDGYLDWDYQTGDNSYSGGAYLHRNWGVVSLYRKSNCRQLAKEAVEQIADSISQSEGV